MSVDKPVSNFIINELTKAQFDGIDPSSTELYMVVDENAGVEIDNSTITENSSNQIQAVGVKDVKTAQVDKFWSGTREEYESLETKDENTFYNVGDDYDLRLNILEILYPVGSLYIASGSLSTCPLSLLGVGTWQLKANSTLVTGVNSTAPVVGNGMTLGLTNGTKNVGLVQRNDGDNNYSCVRFQETAYGASITNAIQSGQANVPGIYGVTTDPTKSGIEANVTSTTLAVTIWERIS